MVLIKFRTLMIYVDYKMKLDGVGLFVNDMPTMVRFYRDVLGFEITEGENTTRLWLQRLREKLLEQSGSES